MTIQASFLSKLDKPSWIESNLLHVNVGDADELDVDDPFRVRNSLSSHLLKTVWRYKTKFYKKFQIKMKEYTHLFKKINCLISKMSFWFKSAIHVWRCTMISCEIKSFVCNLSQNRNFIKIFEWMESRKIPQNPWSNIRWWLMRYLFLNHWIEIE